MRAVPPAPPGFCVEARDRDRLYVRTDLAAVIRQAGLGDAVRWEGLVTAGQPGEGRGAVARLDLPSGPRIVLKQMRRGGLTAGLWRDRFPCADRLVSNLSSAQEVMRRGVATAAPVALLLRQRKMLYRAWMAVEEIEGGRDLIALLRDGRPPRKALAAVMALVRQMHDAGIHHRDLNLGNLLVRRGGDGEWQAFVVDLDRAEIGGTPLSYRSRLRSLRRLERSYIKRFGEAGPLGEGGAASWYALYARDNTELAMRLEAGRRAGRFWLAVHRLGWRR